MGGRDGATARRHAILDADHAVPPAGAARAPSASGPATATAHAPATPSSSGATTTSSRTAATTRADSPRTEAGGSGEAQGYGSGEAQGRGEAEAQAEGEGQEDDEAEGEGQGARQGHAQDRQAAKDRAPALVADVEIQEDGGVDPGAASQGAEVQVGPGGASGRPDDTNGLSPAHELALLGLHLVEVKVERVEPEAVVEHDQPAREEEFPDQGHAPVVDGHDGGTTLHRVVDASVGRPRLTVDDPPRPEAGARLGPGHRADEPSPPEPLGRYRPIEGPEPLGFIDSPSLRLGVEVDHGLGQGQTLDGEVTAKHPDLPVRDP